MKKINNKRDLPKWFKIENYNELNMLDDHELWHELKERISMINETFGTNPKSQFYVPFDENVRFREITRGIISLRNTEFAEYYKNIKPIDDETKKRIEEHTSLSDAFNDQYKEYDLHSVDRHVKPMRIFDIYYLH